MDCERVREEFVERLTGTIDHATAEAVDEHIAGCAACRAETERLREMWVELGMLDVAPVAATTAAARRVGRLISARRASAPADVPVARRGGVRAARVTLGLAAAVVAGVAIGRWTRDVGRSDPAAGVAQQAPAPGGERFLLLLHGPASRGGPSPDAAAQRAVVEEYRAWAERLRSAGQLVSAEKLADEPLRMVARDSSYVPPRFTAEEVGGYFLIQVVDSATAYRVARESPHLKYGGTVQVRRIEPT